MSALARNFAPGVDARVSVGVGRRPSLLARIDTWRRVARERRQLLEVDPRLLADMGLTPEEARREAMRPFWDVGPHR